MLLQVSGISKSYGVTSILSDIHLQVLERERVGLVGVNGAGKSTLLKIIVGEITPDSGNVNIPKEVKVGYLAQATGLHPERTLWQELELAYSHLTAIEKELRELELRMADNDEAVFNRYDRLSEQFREQGGFEKDANMRSIIAGMGFADFPMDTLVKSLSGGQKTRLALAKLLLEAPDLLLDEPTNYLDIETLTWLEGFLRNYRGAVLVVSHDRYFLDALTNVTYEVERTQAKRYSGNYSRFMELKAQQMAIELKHFDRQQDEIRRMEEFVQRNIARATTTKRAQSRRAALDRMERLDRPQKALRRASFRFEAGVVSGNDVLNIEGLSTGYGSKPTLLENLNLRIERGDRLAFVGPNGIGKSTLLKTLVGQIPARAGNLRWGAKVNFAYYDQEHQTLNPKNTILEEVWNSFPHMEEVRIRRTLGGFLFSGDETQKTIASLSGGEKARVALAKLMLLEANVLILDEPTNHLDLASKEVLEDALLEYDGTILMISHDRYFLNRLTDRIVELSPAGAEHYLGNYDDYIEKKAELQELTEKATISVAPTESPKSVSSYEQDKQAKRDERHKQRRLEQLELEIAGVEDEITEIEHTLAKPEVFEDYIAVREWQAKLEDAQQNLANLYKEWEIWLEK
jgi:ATP-binding cassette subfamily F protein 3